MTVIEKYLENYSNHRDACFVYPPQVIFDRAVVIPVRAERELFSFCLESLENAAAFSGTKVLCIIVVNHRISDAEPLKQKNRAHLEELKFYKGPLSLVVMDCANPGVEFPEKQGVGLARKIGCDLALELFHEGQLRSEKVFTTDADAWVPLDYFEGSDSKDSVSIHYFEHTPVQDDRITQATVLYEKWLRYYVLGLRFAGSPYAFQTVGSLLSIDYTAYAMVRGFPRKEAGEDFYLLNKLKKVGEVSTRAKRISLKSRTSDRVPFGTGRAVTDILGLKNPEHYTFYHPDTFSILKEWLELLKEFSQIRDLRKTKHGLFQSISKFSPCASLETLHAFWDSMKFRALLTNADQTRPKNTHCLNHLHTEFDGFRTLRFVHLVRDLLLPEINPDLALKTAVFTEGKTELLDLRRLEEGN